MNFTRMLWVVIYIVRTESATSSTYDEGAVRYEEIPTSQKAVLRDPALLRCVATSTVGRCRWTWRPLGSPPLMRPLIVREFEAFGVESRDCSVRFRSLLLEHEGEWTCSVLAPGETLFHPAPTAIITVVQSEDTLQFSERPEAMQVLSGEPAVLRCVVQRGAEVEECRWTWRPLNQLSALRIPLKQFPPFGNESRDCSVRFRAAQLEQAGEWSCGVRPRGQLNFRSTQPITLIVQRREMKFIELSQDLQVAAGEAVLLRCVTASRVQRCRWMWRQFAPSITHSAPPAIQVKNFAAFGNESRDCSVRFSSVLPEQAGEWTCGVQPVGELYFHDAPPAKLNLLPAVKIRFVEVAEDTRVVRGTPVTLSCAVTANVSICRWTWKPLETLVDVPIYPIEFPPQGNWSRDCSLTLSDVQREHQGLWTCSVFGPPKETLYSAPPAKLTLHNPVEMKFSELTRAIQMPEGSPVLLRCVASQRVERCRWEWRPLSNMNNDANSSQLEMIKPVDPVREFDSFGSDKRDCSIRFQGVETQQTGEWICGVQPEGETNFQNAPPAHLTVLPQGTAGTVVKSPPATLLVTYGLSHSTDHVTELSARSSETSHFLVSIMCRVKEPIISCDWKGPNQITITAINATHLHQPHAADKRFWALVEPDKGLCSLMIFAWDSADAARVCEKAKGHWRCRLYITTDLHIEASTTLSFFNSYESFSTSTTILMLMIFILLIVIMSLLRPLVLCCHPPTKLFPNTIKTSKLYNNTLNTSAKKIRFRLPATEIPFNNSYL